MKVSVITACLNSEDTLEHSIKSVLSQNYPSIEHIVIDGKSSDGTLAIIETYKNMISTFVSEEDDGVYDALNKGIRMASGDIIGFVHADDRLADPNVLSDIAQVFRETNADAVYGDLAYISNDNKNKIVRYWKSGRFSRAKLRAGWMPPHPAMYMKREIYEKAKLFNGEYFDTCFRIASDYDFMIRVLDKMKISVAYLPRVLVQMRTGGVSNKNLRNILLKSKEDYIAIRRNNIGGLSTLLSKNFRKIPQFYNGSA